MGNCLITRKGSNVKLEGNATQEDVLLNKTFYANDKNIKSGTMNNNGAISANVAINGEYTIPKGYHDGNGKVIGPKIILKTYSNFSGNGEIIDTGRSKNKVNAIIACKIYKDYENDVSSSNIYGVGIKMSNNSDMSNNYYLNKNGYSNSPTQFGYKSDNSMNFTQDYVVNFRYFQVVGHTFPPRGANNVISLLLEPSE